MISKIFITKFAETLTSTPFKEYVDLAIFLGSAVNGRWVKGKSDIDVIVFLSKSGVEGKIYEAYLALDKQLDTGLLDIPLYHPPILFVRNSLEHVILAKLLSKKGEDVRKFVKKTTRTLVPRGKCLAKVFMKMPWCFNILALIILYVLESLFDYM
ncbi:MAG: hypothetical protein DRJ31_05790, partial [Candidatus Methanomethylicota archaeon]